MTTTSDQRGRAIEDQHLRAWHDFLRTFKVTVGSLEREMQEERGLPLAWYDILLALNFAPDRRLRLQVLADSVMLSRSGLTRLVDRMTEAGLVERAPCQEDRRGTFAVLTEEGREAFRAAAPGHMERVSEHFASVMDDDDVRDLRRVLGKVLDAAGQRQRSYISDRMRARQLSSVS